MKKVKVAGIRSHHTFIPTSVIDNLSMKRISLDLTYTTVCVGEVEEINDIWIDCQPGRYIACIYDANWYWYISNIIDTSDVLVNFMKPSRNKVFSWPPISRKDECWVPLQHILFVVDASNVM